MDDSTYLLEQLDKIKQDVLDPNHKMNDFMDMIKYGLVSSNELDRKTDYNLFQGLMNVELKARENPEFVRIGNLMESARKSITDLAGMNASMTIANDPTFRKLADQQISMRNSIAEKLVQPVPVWKDIKTILEGHAELWPDKVDKSKQEVDNLQKEIDTLESQHTDELWLETKKVEMQVALDDLNVAMSFVKKTDKDHVSDFLKKFEKEMQKKIIRIRTKPDSDGVVSAQMKRDMYQQFVRYRSLKKGKKPFPDEDDLREPRYTRDECFNLVQANHYDNKSVATIKKYIKQFIKKNR